MSLKSFRNLFVLTILLSSCTSEILQKNAQNTFENQKTKTAVIAGKISHIKVYPHIKEIKLTVPGFIGDDKVFVHQMDSNGEFRFEFYPVVQREVSLSNIEDRIVLGPGDSIHIRKDFSDIMNTDFSGDNAQLNKNISLFRSEYLGRYSHGYKLPYGSYKAFCDSIKQTYLKRLNNFEEKHKTSETFNRWGNIQIDLDYSDAMLEYPYQYWVRTKKEMQDSSDYYAFTKNLDNVYETSLVMTDYYKVSEQLAIYEISRFFKQDMMNEKISDNIFAAFATTDANKRYLNEFLLSYIIHSTLNSNTILFVDKYQDKTEGMITDNFLRYTIDDRYKRTQEYLEHPEKFTELVLGSGDDIETNGKTFEIKDSENNLLKRLISQNTGKVIYFDVWSSGCAPCIHNMKYSKELEAQYGDEDIVFVYLSIDTREDKWRSKVKELELNGTHIRCSREETRDLRERFGFSGIPYYLLVNKKGEIVNFGHHLIPQNKSTQEGIRKLVKEVI